MRKENKIYLLKLARESISDYFENKNTAFLDKQDNELTEKNGCFVTLKLNGDLRGCIGYIEGVEPITSAVITMAREAAFSDPRFYPLSQNELNEIEIEISILTPLIKVKKIEEIIVPGDGLLVRNGYQSGLLLPQVAVEWKYNREQFLSQTCIKAGLDRKCFLSAETKIFRFQAEIFSEIELIN
ncbi:MAG: AMMECR1 domain-containing protein [bacterium (Candidatus Stahlbacteria) CG23_combo_of_CG06-09_8_20_14_all_34_7]|nr:MAG: AMMECR1 domain-containing protein [bacterium (Candidatus Stahlbacteria) CG23_combo_of_CG06-09_8_20_14_all_34_7]